MHPYLQSVAGTVSEGSDAASPFMSAGDFYGHLIQVIISLIVIIGIIVLLIRFMASRNRKWGAERSLRVLAGVALGQNKSLQIVELGGSLYVVGVGENITLLDRIEDLEKVSTLVESLNHPAGPGGTVTDTMSRLMNRIRRPKQTEEQSMWEANEAFRDLLNQKLNGIGNRKAAMKTWMEEEPLRKEREDKL